MNASEGRAPEAAGAPPRPTLPARGGNRHPRSRILGTSRCLTPRPRMSSRPNWSYRSPSRTAHGSNDRNAPPGSRSVTRREAHATGRKRRAAGNTNRGQLVRDHPLRFYTAPSTTSADASHLTATGADGVAGIAIVAEFLGMSTTHLPKTLNMMPTSNTKLRVALQLALRGSAVDPLAEALNIEPAPS